jgi:GNAT superfamily N-acetyltransferase
MKIDIREAGEPDIGKILDIYSQPSIDNGVVLTTKEAGEIFKTIKSYPNYKIYVAEIEKTIVGTIAVLIMHNIGHLGKQSAIFESFAVLPEWQSQGIGKAIIKYVMEICKKAGCYKITLSADVKRTEAHNFYETLGFTQHGYSYKYLIK